jgi:thymidylate synthase ThyX
VILVSDELTSAPLEVFGVTGVSSEEMAFMIAGRSRSPHHFKVRARAILEAGNTLERLDEFVNVYGHGSVRGLAKVEAAIEGASMAVLEIILGRELLEPQGASTRYQRERFRVRPVYIPPSIIGAPQENLYRGILGRCFDLYEATFRCSLVAVRDRYLKPPNMDEKFYMDTTRARALDVARGALPGAVLSSVGASFTAREAIEMIRTLRGHEWEEAQAVGFALEKALKEDIPFNPRRETIGSHLARLAQFGEEAAGIVEQLRKELLLDQPLLPTLLKYTTPTGYERQTYQALRLKAAEVLDGLPFEAEIGAKLIPDHTVEEEIVSTLLFSVDTRPYTTILGRVRSLSLAERDEILALGYRWRGEHDSLIPEYKCGYKIIIERVVPEAQHRDLWRHRNERKTRQLRHWTMPLHVPEELTGQVREDYIRMMEEIRRLAADPSMARSDLQELILPLAFARRSITKADIWQEDYRIPLRTKVQGDLPYRQNQWEELKELATHHPVLAELIRPRATDPAIVDIFRR